MGGRARTQKDIDRAVQSDSYSQPASASADQRWVTVVVALKSSDFDQWCKDNGKNQRDRNLLLATPGSVRGLQNARLEITPIPGQQLQELVADVFATPQDIVSKTRAYLR